MLRHPRLSSGQLTPSSLTPIIFPNLIRQISRYGAAGDWSMLMTRLQGVTLLVNIYCFLFFSPLPPRSPSPFSPWPLARRIRACGEGERGVAGARRVAGPGCAARLGPARLARPGWPGPAWHVLGTARVRCLPDGAAPHTVAPPPCSPPPLSAPGGGGGGGKGKGVRGSRGGNRAPSFFSEGQAGPGPRAVAGGAGAAGRCLPAGTPRCRAPVLPCSGLRAAELRYRPPSEEIRPESIVLDAPEQWSARFPGG